MTQFYDILGEYIKGIYTTPEKIGSGKVIFKTRKVKCQVSGGMIPKSPSLSIPLLFPRKGRVIMVRHRQVGFTKKQWNQYERWEIKTGKNRLTDNQRRCLKYDMRKVAEEMVADLTLYFDMSGGLRGSPFEITLPKRKSRYSIVSEDMRATIAMISLIEEWQTNLERLKEAIIADPQHYIRL